MRRTPFLITAIFFLGWSNSQAQWGNGQIQRFRTEAQKDPAYVKFQGKMKSLVNSAKGTHTNAAAAKTLIIGNKSLFNTLYNRSGMPLPNAMTATTAQQFSAVQEKPAVSIVGTNQVMFSEFVFVKSGQWGSWRKNKFPNGNLAQPFDYEPLGASNPQTMTSKPCTSVSDCYLGILMRGFTASVPVPSNPQIAKAKVKFEYSFKYMGWDTYGSRIGIDLILRALDNFNSPAYNALPKGGIPEAEIEIFKKIGVLFPIDTITTDFAEFNTNTNSNYTIEGYVTPGTTLSFYFGLGFLPGTNKGLNGCYHYGEFQLKKVTVNFYKASE